MNITESYLFLFSDSFFSNLSVNLNSELALHTMIVLGNFNAKVVLAICVLANISAFALNYALGQTCYRIYKSSNDPVIQERHDKLNASFKKYYLLIVMLVVFEPFGKFVILISGFMNASILRIISLAVVFKFLYYVYILNDLLY